ncbi:MAG: hypothetical protein ACD_44C00116G0001, partial [uncultured bacterium]
MCGIVGIASHVPVAAELYESLVHLQHRGQDAAGIVTSDTQFHLKTGLGLVRDTFTPDNLSALKGTMGIAHVRYGTSGGYSLSETQPLLLSHPIPIVLAHNGNLPNDQALREEQTVKKDVLRSTLDTELLLHLFSEILQQETHANQNDEAFFQGVVKAVTLLHARLQGTYSIVSIVLSRGLIAFRDPYGIRPLVFGERKNQAGTVDYIVASETTPFYTLGFEAKGDVERGEVVYISQTGKCYRAVTTQKTFSPCAFEYIYFARPDAILSDVNVYHARLHMGQNLAKRWQETFPDSLPDVVIPAPFTANTAALSFAHELGVRYTEGLYKNPFIGRTFIMPNQAIRVRSVRHKLIPQRTEIMDKKVLIVDDSIVRGTTSREIIRMVRECGAKEVNFVSTCPP